MNFSQGISKSLLYLPFVSPNSNLKLLVTSRPEVNARRILPTLVCVDLKATTEDIETFIREKAQTLPASFDSNLREKTAELILSQVEQTFFGYCGGVRSECLGAGRWQVAGGKEADGKW